MVLRESAQCLEEDRGDFQDIGKHRYFNTNNLWIRLDRLREVLDANGGAILARLDDDVSEVFFRLQAAERSLGNLGELFGLRADGPLEVLLENLGQPLSGSGPSTSSASQPLPSSGTQVTVSWPLGPSSKPLTIPVSSTPVAVT